MSIWVSHPVIGWDDYPDPDEPNPRGGEVRSYATGWSNHYPTRNGHVEQPASIHLASIPAWCVPGHQDSTSDEEQGEWLRIDIESWAHDWHSGGKVVTGPDSAAVVLDEAAARQLVADLTSWLAAPKLARP